MKIQRTKMKNIYNQLQFFNSIKTQLLKYYFKTKPFALNKYTNM